MVHEQQEPVQQGETLSSEVVAFCALIARIVMRCLRERNALVIKAQNQVEKRNPGGSHDPAG